MILQTTVDDIMKVMPGPDFPTGGIICGYRGIQRGLSYRAWKSHFAWSDSVEEEVDDHPDKQRLVIDEIPYNVNKSRLIEQIAELD